MSPAWKDRYQPLEIISETDHGRLVHAVDLIHDRPVALKIRTARTPELHAAARREARTLLSLRPHPGLPTVRDDFVEGDDYVLVLDWVEGTDLGRVLADRGSPGMPPAMVVAWMRDLGDAVEHLHRHDPPIIHGDIKPANAIVTPTGRVVLVDLGSADTAVASPGTPGYAAPEIAAGAAATIGADIYALAATAYALLAGRPPASGPAVDDRLDPTAVALIERALRPALALDPARRPASAAELIHRIVTWAQSNSPAEVEPPAPASLTGLSRRPSQPSTALVVAAGALLAAAVVSAIALAAARHPLDRAPRFQGADRYATAAALAVATFPTAPVVVIARADQPADALAANYLAGAQHAPLLYASPDGLSVATVHALTTIHTRQAFIIGDDTAVSANVEDRLTRLGIRAVRVAAPNRYSTAAVITQAGGSPAALGSAGATAIIIDDHDAAALTAIGPLSYGAHLPVLYTTAGGIPPETQAALTENHVRHVLTAGAISEQTTSQLNGLNVTIESLGSTVGPSAAVSIAGFELDTLGWSAATTVLARGDDYPDALAAAARAGLRHAPLLLSESAASLGPSATGFLSDQPPLHELDLIGDPSAIDGHTAQAAKAAAHLAAVGAE